MKLTVNGEERSADVVDHESLLTVLRERLGLPGSKNACEQGECGSCSVFLDGELVCACLVLGAATEGRTVETVKRTVVHPAEEADALTGSPFQLCLERRLEARDDQDHVDLATARREGST